MVEPEDTEGMEGMGVITTSRGRVILIRGMIPIGRTLTAAKPLPVRAAAVCTTLLVAIMRKGLRAKQWMVGAERRKRRRRRKRKRKRKRSGREGEK